MKRYQEEYAVQTLTNLLPMYASQHEVARLHQTQLLTKKNFHTASDNGIINLGMTLFWIITQRVAMISYQLFRTTYRSVPSSGFNNPKESL